MNIDKINCNARAVVPAPAVAHVTVFSKRDQLISNLEAKINEQNIRIQNLDCTVPDILIVF